MRTLTSEPIVSVGLMDGPETVNFHLTDDYRDEHGRIWPAGGYSALSHQGSVEIIDSANDHVDRAAAWRLEPLRSSSSFIIRDIVIGISFHWEQKQDQEFNGVLRFQASGDARLRIINEIPLETYLTSVISSEMSGGSDLELLKAHAIISRSWLLAQLSPWKEDRVKPATPRPPAPAASTEPQLIRWYDRETHLAFDVCADDHCQRYQGITRATSPEVAAAVKATWGEVLTFEGVLCDARFSKSCGGMTEGFSAAWEDLDYGYLAVSYDGEEFPGEIALPLTEEVNAANWIRGRPPAFCNTDDHAVLRKILPDFDQRTTDFYRWRVTLTQEELQYLLRDKLGIELGAILRMEPLERGGSGRIVRLRLVGSTETLVIGKELEIRRALSPSHLYSSAFVVDPGPSPNGIPAEFALIGAGWGHGVGLCQIGAAIMAERGYNARQILAHYYRGARMEKLYD